MSASSVCEMQDGKRTEKTGGGLEERKGKRRVHTATTLWYGDHNAGLRAVRSAKDASVAAAYSADVGLTIGVGVAVFVSMSVQRTRQGL